MTIDVKPGVKLNPILRLECGVGLGSDRDPPGRDFAADGEMDPCHDPRLNGRDMRRAKWMLDYYGFSLEEAASLRDDDLTRLKGVGRATVAQLRRAARGSLGAWAAEVVAALEVLGQ
jgi:hypothetical protein